MKVDPELVDRWWGESDSEWATVSEIINGVAQRAAEWGAEQERSRNAPVLRVYQDRAECYEELRKATDGGSESMTHEDAVASVMYMQTRIAELTSERDALRVTNDNLRYELRECASELSMTQRKPITEQQKCVMFHSAVPKMNDSCGAIEYYYQGIEDAERAHEIGEGKV